MIKTSAHPDAISPLSPRDTGGIVLVSCYELGHRPLALTSAASHLAHAGFRPSLCDTSIDPLDELSVARARLVAVSVPMHTALRLGVWLARRVRRINPHCHIAFFGVYAALNAEHLLSTVADTCLGGEFEAPLVELATALCDGASLDRFRAPQPHAEYRTARASRRDSLAIASCSLPPLDAYVQFTCGGIRHPVAYVATTRGCKHRCRHCPITPVYDGSFYAIPADKVLAHIRHLVERGARHVTFADPDFLNAPGHARRIVTALHTVYPDITFDYTAKISHLLKHGDRVREFKDRGCAFVVSAIESLSPRSLAALDKGHTADDALRVIRFFRSIGLSLRPSLMPFTPWDTLQDYLHLLATVERESLIDHIDPVQYTIRLLIPPGSALLETGDITPFLGTLDKKRFSYVWCHPDPRMDRLHGDVSHCVESAVESGEDVATTFYRIRNLALRAAGFAARPELRVSDPDRPRPPRLSESWFC